MLATPALRSSDGNDIENTSPRPSSFNTTPIFAIKSHCNSPIVQNNINSRRCDPASPLFQLKKPTLADSLQSPQFRLKQFPANVGTPQFTVKKKSGDGGRDLYKTAITPKAVNQVSEHIHEPYQLTERFANVPISKEFAQRIQGTPVAADIEQIMRRLSLSAGKKAAAKTLQSPIIKSRLQNQLLNSPNTWQLKKGSRRGALQQQQSTLNGDRFISNRQDQTASSFLLNRTVSTTLSNNAQDSMTNTTLLINSAKKSMCSNKKADGSLMGSVDLKYQSEIAKAVGFSIDQRILSFRKKAPSSSAEKELSARYLNKPGKAKGTSARRKIPTVPERVLDAPGILDDFYLNLLDWSNQNVLAVSLGPTVYLWNADSGNTDELFTTDNEDSISSLSWASDGAHLAIGDLNGQTHLINVGTQKRVRVLPSGQGRSLTSQTADSLSRIGSLSWNKGMLSTGSSNGDLTHHDVRLASSVTARSSGHHTGEVVGLKWSPTGNQLASGGNDNLLHLWDIRNIEKPNFSISKHAGAVKALAWCHWQSGLLASGGGTNDGKIHFWNTSNGQIINTIETGSQITSLHWSKTYRELVSSHGFCDGAGQRTDAVVHNHLTVWKYPTMSKVIELPHAHESRILHMTLSPDGQTVCTGAADENLKFWKLFAFDPKSVKTKGSRKIIPGVSDSNKASPDFGGASSVR